MTGGFVVAEVGRLFAAPHDGKNARGAARVGGKCCGLTECAGSIVVNWRGKRLARSAEDVPDGALKLWRTRSCRRRPTEREGEQDQQQKPKAPRFHQSKGSRLPDRCKMGVDGGEYGEGSEILPVFRSVPPYRRTPRSPRSLTRPPVRPSACPPS
jgi:hypothetical protein